MATNNSINSFRADNLVYVATNGSDAFGNGSIYNPYLTISKALSTITTASSANRFAVIIQSGQYNETTLAMIPYVSLVGNGYNNTRITTSTNQVTLGSGFSGTSARIGFFNLILTGTTGIQFDVSALSAGSLVVDVWNCWINGAVNFIGRTAGNDFFQTFLSSYFATVTLSTINVTSVSNVYNSNFVLNNAATNGNSLMDSQADFYGGSLTVQSTGSNTSTMTIFGSYITSTFASNGANAMINIDVSTYRTPTLSNGGSLTLKSISNGLLANYTPVNYSPSDISVNGHLVGIDTALGSIPGRATLSLGSVTVSYPSITNNSNIFPVAQDNNTVGSLRISSRTPGTGFTITSSMPTDSGVVAYKVY